MLKRSWIGGRMVHLRRGREWNLRMVPVKNMSNGIWRMLIKILSACQIIPGEAIKEAQFRILMWNGDRLDPTEQNSRM